MLRNPKEKNISREVVQNVQCHWKCPLNSTSWPLMAFQELLRVVKTQRPSFRLLMLRLTGCRRWNSLYFRDSMKKQEACSHSRISLLLGQQKKHSMKTQDLSAGSDSRIPFSLPMFWQLGTRRQTCSLLGTLPGLEAARPVPVACSGGASPIRPPWVPAGAVWRCVSCRGTEKLGEDVMPRGTRRHLHAHPGTRLHHWVPSGVDAASC